MTLKHFAVTALVSLSATVACADPLQDPLARTPQGRVQLCEKQMKRYKTALEMYSTDHQGLYPNSLQELSDSYLMRTPSDYLLGRIPTCPAARKDTYSFSYKPSADHKKFVLFCKGNWHKEAGLARDFPRWDFAKGMQER